MSKSAFDKVLHFVYSSLVIYTVGVVATALLAPVFQSSVEIGAVLNLIFALALFAFPVFAPISFVGGLVLCVASSRERIPLGVILVFALALGLGGSVLFQYLRPFDFYHEAAGSHPGWAPVRIQSSLTAMALCSSLLTMTVAALLSRRVSR